MDDIVRSINYQREGMTTPVRMSYTIRENVYNFQHHFIDDKSGEIFLTKNILRVGYQPHNLDESEKKFIEFLDKKPIDYFLDSEKTDDLKKFVVAIRDKEKMLLTFDLFNSLDISSLIKENALLEYYEECIMRNEYWINIFYGDEKLKALEEELNGQSDAASSELICGDVVFRIDNSPESYKIPEESPTITNEFLDALSKEIFEENLEMGWWQKDALGVKYRDLPTLISLFHSELSEAFDSVTNTPLYFDDKLTNRRGFDVEIADTTIRILDLLGAYGIKFKSIEKYHSRDSFNFKELENDKARRMGDKVHMYEVMLRLHSQCSRALECFRKNGNSMDDEDVHTALQKAVYLCFYAEKFFEEGVTLLQLIEEKRNFNRERADHKLENRMKEGGKSF